MKTNDLISMLAKDSPLVDYRARRTRLFAVLIMSVIASVVVVIVGMKVNPVLSSMVTDVWFWVRATFVGSVMVLSWLAFTQLGKPGVAARVRVWPLLIPIAVLILAGVLLLLAAPQDHRLAMVMGVSWKVSSLNITMLSIPIFLASVWIARQFAPTRLRLTGAVLGLFSGALAAMIYTLHCPELAPSFLMIWYVLGMFIPALLGALLGPRLLAW
jgi:hypothetical protein